MLARNMTPEYLKDYYEKQGIELSNEEVKQIFKVTEAYIHSVNVKDAVTEEFSKADALFISMNAGVIANGTIGILYDLKTGKAYRVVGASVGENVLPVDLQGMLVTIKTSDSTVDLKKDLAERNKAMLGFSAGITMSTVYSVQASISSDGKYSYSSIGVVTNVGVNAGVTLNVEAITTYQERNGHKPD